MIRAARQIASVATMMRRVLVNHARDRNAAKRGAGALVVTLSAADQQPQQELDLAVDAPQIVVGPALQGEERPLVEAEQEGFSFSHGEEIAGGRRGDPHAEGR